MIGEDFSGCTVAIVNADDHGTGDLRQGNCLKDEPILLSSQLSIRRRNKEHTPGADKKRLCLLLVSFRLILRLEKTGGSMNLSTRELEFAAIDLHRLHGISYWDALVLHCARKCGCRLRLRRSLDTFNRRDQTGCMTFTVEIEDDAFRAAGEALHSAGVTPEQAIATYFWRIAHNEEFADTCLHTDRTPMPRTIREQLYRFS